MGLVSQWVAWVRVRVEFRILGPLELLAGAERLELRGVRQQVVLAMLLLNAGAVVSVGRLEEAIYGEDLPPTSRTQAMIDIIRAGAYPTRCALSSQRVEVLDTYFCGPRQGCSRTRCWRSACSGGPGSWVWRRALAAVMCPGGRAASRRWRT